MTIIKANCSQCGEVELTNTEVTLHVYEGEVFEAYYSFICPECDEECEKPADDRVRFLLVHADVQVIVMHVPAEVFERPISNVPLTLDYMIDLHDDLENFNADAAL